jgi:hypothetical protein
LLACLGRLLIWGGGPRPILPPGPLPNLAAIEGPARQAEQPRPSSGGTKHSRCHRSPGHQPPGFSDRRHARRFGTYLLTDLLTSDGLAKVSLLVAAVAVAGAVVSAGLLPEPRGKSLEELTETTRLPPSVVALGLAESRGARPSRA